MSGNFRKDWNKFPEIFREKFMEISELTTMTIMFHLLAFVANNRQREAFVFRSAVRPAVRYT